MDFSSKLLEACSEVLFDEPMSRHTTFKIGGPAKYFAKPCCEAEIVKIIEVCKLYDVEYFVCGNGSNLLVSDDGFDGLIICISNDMSDITIDGDIIVAKAGAKLSSVGRIALDNCLTGFEFASGIPGCVGGAVYMNAGAYGGEIKDCIVSARVMDKNGNIRTLNNEELGLSYRHSTVMEEELIVIEATFKLSKGEQENILSRMKELSESRRTKQPLEYPSAGSTFKRPVGYFAGKLIEDAGLKGYSVGDIEVSKKHSGFVINKGSGTAKDFIKLTDDVKEKVLKEFGVLLELEVKLLGF